MALDIVIAAMEHLARTESRANVFMSLITVMCDCTVHLDGELAISELESTDRLTALLLRRGHCLVGIDFRSLLATGEDVDTLNNAFLQQNSNSSHLLHIRMKDSMGSVLPVQVFWMCGEDIDGKPIFILGITQESQRTIPETNTDEDLVAWDQQLEQLPSGHPTQNLEYGPSVSQESGSQISHCTSLGANHFSLTVLATWPMAIFESDCSKLQEQDIHFSEFFTRKKKARAFHQLLLTRLEEVAVAAKLNACTFPIVQALGTVELRLAAIGMKYASVLVTLEVVDEGESDGSSASSRKPIQDRAYGNVPQTKSRSIKSAILHLSSPTHAPIDDPPSKSQGSSQSCRSPQECKACDQDGRRDEALKDSTASNTATLRMQL